MAADVFERSQTLTLSQCSVLVAEAGAVDGAPLVLLHGNPDTHHVWSGVVERLKGKYRCIAPDLPGFGASTAQSDVSFEGLASFVKELLDKLALERVNLVIHDVGSTYGMSFAALHPERLRTLTIFNGNFFPDYHWHFWGRVWRTPLLGEVSMLFGTEGLFVQQVRKAAPRLPEEYARHAYKQYSKKTRRQVLRFYRWHGPEKLVGWDTKLLAALKNVKYQVLWGDCDPYIDKKFADRFGASGGAVHHFPELSHWVMAEDPERAAKYIDELAR